MIWFTCWKFWFRKLVVCNWTRRKQKILTTSPSESSEFVDVRGDMVRVIHAETVHKYLGRNLGGNFLGQEKFWICPSSAGCLEQISQIHQIQTYLIEQACLFGFAAEIIWPSGVSCHALRTCNLAIDKGLLAKTWCRAKTNASVYSWVGSNSWWPQLAGHYGANESQIGDCENFVPNGGLGRQTLPIKVSTCTSDCTLTWRMAGLICFLESLNELGVEFCL